MFILTISQEIYDQLVAYGEESPTEEVCGALLGKKFADDSWVCDEFIPMTNVSTEGHSHHYVADPNELFQVLSKTTLMFDDAEKDLVGIFHTHPNHEPTPSITDIGEAGYEGAYLIYSPNLQRMSAHYYDGSLPVFYPASLFLGAEA